MNRSEDSVMEGGSLWKAAWTSKFLEFFGKCGASRMLMAGAQSISSGVGPD